METPMSFAPLAARLAARAAEIRPAHGTRVDVAMIMALFVCALLEMLISVCEAPDAAAAQAARVVAAVPSRDVASGSVQAPRAVRQAPSSEKRAPRLTLVPAVQALASTPKPDKFLSRIIERSAPTTPWLAWSRDPGPIRAVLAPPWRPRRETKLFQQRSSTPIHYNLSNCPGTPSRT